MNNVERIEKFRDHIRKIEIWDNKPFFIRAIFWIFSKFEPKLLKLGNWSLEIFKNNRAWYTGPAKIIPWSIGKIISTVFFHSQVLTVDEVKNLIINLNDSSKTFIAAIGICPCRKGMNKFSETIPAMTDIQIYTHGRIYPKIHPDFSPISATELLKKLDEFDEYGLVHTAFGVCNIEGSELAICNCDKDVCFPLRAEIQKQYRIIPGWSKMTVISNVCDAKCEVIQKCIEICPVNARLISKKTGKIYVNADCIGCGVCERICPNKANKYIPRVKKYKRMIPRVMVERN